MDKLAKELTIEKLPDGIWKTVAEEIGIKNLCKLLELTGGATLYIPQLDSFLRPVRDDHIKAEFNGYNHFDLAQKYNVSVRWVRELCGLGIIEGQIGFFEQFPGNDS